LSGPESQDAGARAAAVAGSPEVAESKKAHMRFPGVRAPKPLLSREAERALSARQLELLDALEAKLADTGLGDLTMAEIAASVGCSLRTLYAIAPSRDELLLTLADRRLHRIGRAAIEALDPDLPPLDALRTYLRIANEAVRPQAVTLSSDVARVAGAGRVIDAHENYLAAVAQSLLDRAVADGAIAKIDTAAVAHVLGGLGREFARPEVAELIEGSPNETADVLTDLIIRGLQVAPLAD
jgi:AcrR family transcriptional regulator